MNLLHPLPILSILCCIDSGGNRKFFGVMSDFDTESVAPKNFSKEEIEVGEILGKGAYGAVYKVQLKSNRALYAMKKMARSTKIQLSSQLLRRSCKSLRSCVIQILSTMLGICVIQTHCVCLWSCWIRLCGMPYSTSGNVNRDFHLLKFCAFCQISAVDCTIFTQTILHTEI
jgi:serine/threonine protein kinase